MTKCYMVELDIHVINNIKKQVGNVLNRCFPIQYLSSHFFNLFFFHDKIVSVNTNKTKSVKKNVHLLFIAMF